MCEKGIRNENTFFTEGEKKVILSCAEIGCLERENLGQNLNEKVVEGL